jgi:DNA-binding CsgD family transcriptional regulator
MPRPAAETADIAARALADGQLVTHDGPETFAACYALGVVDRLAEAHRAASDAIDAAVRQGAAWRCVYLLAVRGEMAYRMGRLADAEADVSQGYEMLGNEPAPLPRAVLAKVLLCVLIERGRLDEATGELDRLGALDRAVMTHADNELRFLHGKLLVARGEAQAGSDVLLACGELEDAWQVTSPAMLPWRSACSEALVLSGKRQHAARLAREELELARAVGAPRAVGIALRAAALAAERDESIGLLREAVATLEDSPARLEHARALTDLGATLRRADRRADARAVLTRALDIAYDCGADALAERARTELLAAGSRPRRMAIEGRDSLTPSERRVASMAAEGRTNKELAQALFVTVKTVEMHLANTYRKLGIRSRAELTDALQAAQAGDIPG